MTPHPPAPPAPPAPPIAAPPAPVLDYYSTHKSAADACQKRLRQLNMPPGQKIMAENKPPGKHGMPVPIETNVFGLELQKESIIHSYVVHISADLRTKKEAVFTKKGKDDYIVLDRRDKCCDIFSYAIENETDFFQLNRGNKIIYDGQSVLYTTVDLFPGIDNSNQKRRLLQIDGSKVNNVDLHNLSLIKLEIYVGDRNIIKFNRENLLQRTADPNLAVNDRSYAQFIDLVLNQNCTRDTKTFGCFEKGKCYFLKPEKQGFQPNDCILVGDGKRLLPGLKKTVSFIEGPLGRGHNNPSLVVDAMKSAFHIEQTVYDKIDAILGPRRPNQPRTELNKHEVEQCFSVIKGLDVYSKYTRRTRHLKIEGLYHANAENTKFQLDDGSKVSVREYFQTKYNYVIKYPKMNLLVCKERANKNYYPVELMYISPNQRVTVSQQTSQQSQKTTKESAVLPLERQRLIMTGMNAAGLLQENELLNDLGIKLYEDPLMVSGREMESRTLRYNAELKTAYGKWRPPGCFVRPAVAPKIWAIYAVGTSSSRFGQSTLQKFAIMFYTEIKRKGINFNEPAEISCVSCNDIRDKLETASIHGCKFVFCITDDKITNLHGYYKYAERKYEMVIQDMRMSIADKCANENKRLTMENVINKTNVKLGGLNYHVIDDSLNDDILVVGVGISYQAVSYEFVAKGILNPTIIGFATNAASTQEFVGDFILSTCGQDTIVSIEDIIHLSVEKFKNSKRKAPKKIIVYRTGSSEGGYAAILSHEVPLVRAAIQRCGVDSKLIYITVSKDHSFRFFKSQIIQGNRAADQNIPSGVVIDQEVVHPSFKQFFLNAHTTLQGSAKSPLYTVLYDEVNAPMDRLEGLTYSLCHHHQIVSLATSLPTPLYVANESAKRGKMLWNERTCSSPPSSSDSDRQRLKEITEELAYANSEFKNIRVNA